ncbi:unnamed protein product, partial [Ectocarpus fasciculatus]
MDVRGTRRFSARGTPFQAQQLGGHSHPAAHSDRPADQDARPEVLRQGRQGGAIPRRGLNRWARIPRK